jgi:hypothetical protein
MIGARLMNFLAVACLLAATTAQAPIANPIKMPAIPEGKETDIKIYANGDGTIVGREALEQMPKAGLNLWLAGNQFFAMDDVIGGFHKLEPRLGSWIAT